MTPIPDAALAQHVAILGKTGSGKSNAAKVIVEGLLDRGERVCAIDPTGTWWGLRLAADGKRPSPYPAAIFGGQRADMPIGPDHGGAIAEAIGTSRSPAIIDTRLMKVGERTRFFTGFAETLLRVNSGPLHLVIDEAHVFMPQGKVPDPQSGMMLHAANNLVSLGRGIGLRIVLISQRPAKVHKDSLTQVETLVALRLIAPQDRRAIEDWVGEWADPKQGAELLKSLPSLKTGEAWIWSPELGVLKRDRFPLARTFDSGRAPTGDEGPKLGAIDLTALRERLVKVEAEAKANDPRTLRTEIARLERELAAAKRAPAADPAAVEAARRDGYHQGRFDAWSVAAADLHRLEDDVAARISGLHKDWSDKHVVEFGGPVPPPRAASSAPAMHRPAPQMHKAAAPRPRGNGTAAPMSKAERLILTALAQYPDGRSKRQVAILSGYAINGGGFNNAISSARGKGWLEGSGDRMRITDAGMDALGPFDPLPHGAALLEHWLRQLGKAEASALRAVAEVYPADVPKEEVARRAGYEASGGGFNNALSRLRTLELIEGRGSLRASDALFG